MDKGKNQLNAKQVIKILAKNVRSEPNELLALKEGRWFDKACFQRAFGDKPSWLNPIYRIFFNSAMRCAIEIGTKILDLTIVVLPVWHCRAYEEPESKWTLNLLTYFGPGFSYELRRHKKATIIHARVNYFRAPYISHSWGYASSIKLPRFGPYAVVDALCGLELTELYEAIELESISSPPDLELKPFNESLKLAIPLTRVPGSFRDSILELINDYEKLNAEINRDADRFPG
ncbi:hypothetical protein EHQ05_20015 [Leptospira yasudae]|uniref:hypothetical protein n=1 Tax=Leptospira yasudae TaxID=2202201 RepID=UPI0010827533|nr:hypothetical protein [Leptospira yasudae]TGK23079.1 hypothetical protein EHQ05_20015 [Leptospira yasudae]TGM03387.1 hypothetical protein EHQ86_15865 [Leptospira yasudae]